MKNSKILIVGGLGYLGSKLSSDILIYNKKIELSIIDILDTSNFQIYKSLVSLGLKNYFNININFKNLLEEHFKKNYYNIVINLASIVGAPLCDLYKNEAIILNQNSAINLAKIIDKNTRYIFASTGSCYGKIGTYCDENVKIKPVSIYAKTKANVEKKIKSRKNTTILRFTTVFGISIKTRDDLLINSFVKRSLRDKSIVIYEPNAKRNFISIDEISTTIIKLIKLKNIDGIYNVGNPYFNLSKLQIVKIIKSFVDFHYELNDFNSDVDSRDYFVSIDKLTNLIGKNHFKKNIHFYLDKIVNYYKDEFISEKTNI